MEITILSIVFRISVMYVVALTLIRISGKQSVSELSTMDFVVVTLLGDAFDSVIFSEVTIAEGMVYFTTIVLLHIGVRFLSARSTMFHHVASSPPTVMIENGSVVWKGLQAEWTRVETVFADIRLKGEDRLEEVKEARLEENGQLSVVRKESSKPLPKKDRALLTK